MYSTFPSHWCYNIVHTEGKGLYKGKANLLQAWTGPEVSSNLRLPEFLHSRHMKVLSLSVLHNGRLNPAGDSPGINFCQRLGRPQGYSAAERIISIKNSSDTIGNRNRDLTSCSAVRHRLPPKGFYTPLMSQTDIICPHICGPVEIQIFMLFLLLYLTTPHNTIMYIKITKASRVMRCTSRKSIYGASVPDGLTR